MRADLHDIEGRYVTTAVVPGEHPRPPTVLIWGERAFHLEGFQQKIAPISYRECRSVVVLRTEQQ